MMKKTLAISALVLGFTLMGGVNAFAWGVVADQAGTEAQSDPLKMTTHPDSLRNAISQNPHGSPVGEGAVPVGEGAVPVGEGAVPVGEGAVPVGEGAVPVGEGAVPVGEGAVPVGEGAVPVGEGAHPTMNRGPSLIRYN